MYAKILSAQPDIKLATLIEIEINLSDGMPSVSIVGLPDKAVDEAKDRVSSAIENSNIDFYNPDLKTLKNYFGKITISLAPANLKKSGSVFDLPIALSFLAALSELPKDKLDDYLFVGELGLDSSLKEVPGVLSIAKLAQKLGKKFLVVPKENAEEAAFVKGIKVLPASNLKEVVMHLRSEKLIQSKNTINISNIQKDKTLKYCLDDVVGNEVAKRALKIAAAGGHNIALFGPPGTGKSMLAKVFTDLLPNLNYDEALEVTSIHSFVQENKNKIITRPPFRAPHHSASYASIIGGGTKLMPGEITLAHRGVLFLDEFPEFDRRVINSLREPLEENEILISRANGTTKFPANFILIVALNPCPCGYYGTSKCTCSINAIQKYQNKISGPIADRIDIWVNVNKVEYKKLLENSKHNCEEHKKAEEEILSARLIQKERFTCNTTNAKMSVKQLNKYVKLSEKQKNLLESAAERLNLSARAFHKVIKVSRTIADLEGSEDIKDEHLLEALNYREQLIK